MSHRDLVVEARELLAKATPGPWTQTQARTTTMGRQYIEIEHRNSNCVSDMICQIDSEYLCAADLNETDKANAALIARTPELISDLCDEVERLCNTMSMLVCNSCHNRIGWNETPTKYGDWTKCTSCKEARKLLRGSSNAE